VKINARLHVAEELREEAEIFMDERETHYLRDVRRLEEGDLVGVFNGSDGEWDAVISRLGKRDAKLIVGEQRRPQAVEPDVWLVFAPVKRTHIDFVAQKATELGVSALQPVVTQHTVVERVNADRLQAIAIEAAEQCERLSVPQVFPTVTLRELLATWPQERRLLLCAEAGAASPIADTLSSYAGADRRTATPWAIMTGPEGGFARSELDALSKLPFAVPVGLGPRILRADTAALAALACWQAILGDGQQRPPHRSSG
jgi:16S rRNA (uracil1498-N3)-methyltransferase